jgi:pimeloyl-ACP methyl ester carboxylesterase
VKRTVAIAALVLAGLGTAVLLSRLADATRKTRAEGGWAALRLAFPEPDERIALDSFPGRLDVAVYRPANVPPAASILLLHGNRRAGADAGLYRLLARCLAERGAEVYAPSLPGYGRSDPYPEGRAVSSADFRRAAGDALALVRNRAHAGSPVAVVGHSLGANLALGLVHGDLSVVAIEPGRRLRERVWETPSPDLPEFVEKLRGNIRGGVVDESSVRTLYRALDPELGAPGPPGPCAVLYTRRLSPPDLDAVRRIGGANAAEIVWLDNRGHDFGAEELLGGVAYPSPLIETLVDTILSRISAPDAREK